MSDVKVGVKLMVIILCEGINEYSLSSCDVLRALFWNLIVTLCIIPLRVKKSVVNNHERELLLYVHPPKFRV
jgi:hypothetical protein